MVESFGSSILSLDVDMMNNWVNLDLDDPGKFLLVKHYHSIEGNYVTSLTNNFCHVPKYFVHLNLGQTLPNNHNSAKLIHHTSFTTIIIMFLILHTYYLGASFQRGKMTLWFSTAHLHKRRLGMGTADQKAHPLLSCSTNIILETF